MKIARRWIPLLVLAVVTVVLAFLIRDFVRQVIVLPVVYVGWYAWIVLSNLPYWFFWALLLGIVLAVALTSLRGRDRPRRVAPPAEAAPQGPVTNWYRLFAQAERSSTARRRLARTLGQFLWRTRYPDLPYNETIFLQHAEDDRLELTRETRAYFGAGLLREGPSPRRRFNRERAADPLDLPPEHAVAFLEDRLNPSQLE